MNTQKKKSSSRIDRRTHCRVDTLPLKLQTAVGRMILNEEWPADFEDHYNGTPRYTDIVQYCKKKGFSVSKSAVGRFALRLQKLPHIRTASAKMRPYIFAHLAEVCREFADIQDDLLTAEMHPEHAAESYNPSAKAGGKELAQRLVEEKLNYIEKVIREVRSMG